MVAVISIHIPKTAGSTVKRLLEQRLGDGLKTFYDGSFTRSGKPCVNGDLDPRVRVIHGHLCADLAKRFIPDAQLSVWLRDPVERAASYYYYWLQTPVHGNPNHDRFLREQPSLEEFSRHLRSEVADYLGGISLEQFGFVGIVEYSAQDLPRFDSWISEHAGRSPAGDSPATDDLSTLRENQTSGKQQLSAAERARIRRVLWEEVELYETALALLNREPFV